MKKNIFRILAILTLFIFPSLVFANTSINNLDALDDEKTIDNYKKSIEICQQALKENPKDFDITWRCARSYRWYGELAKRQGSDGWKDVCAEYGKKGMGFAQKAIDIQPNKPNGYYWYALNVGIYSDGVSIITALREGLKDKTQDSFEKTYQLEKMHEKAGSVLGLGRFWYVLPWPLNDKELSEKYYREYQKTEYFGVATEDGPIYLAELLIDLGGDKNEAEAKVLLENSVKTKTKYFKDRAAALLKKLD
jgi:tetratricopeptide (TPR) repeat protein